MAPASRFPTHGPELRALLAACHREPDDDTPRLVMADWLQEHDDPRGELVRLQVRLAAMPADDPEYDTLFKQHNRWWRKYGSRYERETGYRLWDFGPHNRGLPTIGYHGAHYAFLHADELRESAPKSNLALSKNSLPQLIAIGWPGMTWVFARDFQGVDGFEDDTFEQFPEQIAKMMCEPFHEPPWIGSPTPVGVRIPAGLTVTTQMINEAAKVPNIRGLSLCGALAGPVLLSRIARIKTLDSLDLGEMRLDDAGVRALAPLKNLRMLVAPGAVFTNAGVAALRSSPSCANCDSTRAGSPLPGINRWRNSRNWKCWSS